MRTDARTGEGPTDRGASVRVDLVVLAVGGYEVETGEHCERVGREYAHVRVRLELRQRRVPA